VTIFLDNFAKISKKCEKTRFDPEMRQKQGFQAGGFIFFFISSAGAGDSLTTSAEL